MARKISNLNKGVYVMITPINARAIGRIISKTGRTFSMEVNMMLAAHVNELDGKKEVAKDELATV
jgi:hypothetical protein